MKPIALLTATRWEFQAVCRALPGAAVDRRHGQRRARGRSGAFTAQVVQTGVGRDAAWRTAEQVLSTEASSMVLSVGFAGALVDARVGDLVIATEVLEVGNGSDAPSARWACSPPLCKTAASAASGASLPARQGALLTVPTIVVTAGRKAELGAATAAIGLDMESAAVAASAARHGVPFLAVRAVSDRANEDLPSCFNDFLVPGGWVRGILALLGSPADWPALGRLRRQSQAAGARLSEFVEAFLNAQG